MNLLFLLFCTSIFAGPADHLLLTRVITQPNEAESISIYNPTNSTINLRNYYICDDNEYYLIQSNSISSSNISGYMAQFPDMDIETGETMTIVFNENYQDFFGDEFTADLLMFGSNDNSLNGHIGFGNDKIEETAEIIILFYWDGESELIKDIDYFSWSSLEGVNLNGINKSGISNYQDDTSIENQFYYTEKSLSYYAYSRIDMEESTETQTNGNGITGHDETSENLRDSWEIIELFNLGCMNITAINYEINAEVDDGSCYYTTISEIVNEQNIGQEIITAGIISDYYKPTNGPHIVTIAENLNGFIIELSIWDTDWTDDLQEIFDGSPFFTHEIKVTGIVGEYETKLQITPSSIQILNNDYQFQANKVSINSILEGNHDDRIVSCNGLLMDYFDVTIYDGPHALTIENEQGYRIELSIWPNTYDIPNSPNSYLIQPPFGQYYLSVMGSIGEYDNEKQLSISSANAITILDTINISGKKYEGLLLSINFDMDFETYNNEFKDLIINDLATQLNINNDRINIISIKNGSFIMDINILEKLDNQNEPFNVDLLNIITNINQINEIDVSIQEITQLSMNSATIIPAPYIIIPTLGEKLDFTYSFPNNSRVIIRIFDLSGKFVTSLVDQFYENSSTVFRDEYHSSWGGRDQLGQIVPPGTYIMHIEAMNPSTGETYSNSAPIVVGVKN